MKGNMYHKVRVLWQIIREKGKILNPLYDWYKHEDNWR